MSDRYPPPKRQRFDPMIFLLVSPLNAIFILLQALFFAVLFDWAAMVWVEPKMPNSDLVEHEQAVMQKALNNIEGMTIKTYSGHAVSHWLYQQSQYTLIHLRPLAAKIQNPIEPLQAWISGAARLNPYWWSIPTSVERSVWRSCLYLGQLPWIVLILCVAIVDGLIQRQRRVWGGGRESSHHFELARRCIKPLLMCSFVLFVAIPVVIEPFVILLPFTILIALSLWQACARFKKYF